MLIYLFFGHFLQQADRKAADRAHYLKQREALNTALPIGVRQVVVFSTYTGNHINPMALPENLTDLQEAIAEKGEFMPGICEQ